MSNLIGLLALVSAVMLPVIVILLSDLGRGLRLDRRLIIMRILKLQWVTFAAVATMTLLFFGIALEVADDAAFLAVAYTFAIIYIIVAFSSMISAISWLNSEDFSSHWHRNPDREFHRLQYLCCRNRRDGAGLWEEFWLDAQTYQYLGAGHLAPYIKTFLRYLATTRPKDQEYAQLVAKSFRTALVKIYRFDHESPLGRELLAELLHYFEAAYLTQNQQQELWGELISGYMTVMRLAPSESDDLLETDEYPYSEWQSAFGYALAIHPVVRDRGAIKALAEVLRRHYRENVEGVAEQKRYLASIRQQAPSGHKKFYRALSGAIGESGSNKLASFLIEQAERPEEK